MERVALKRGRPRLGTDARPCAITSRVSVDEFNAWAAAAEADGIPLGIWLAQPRRADWRKIIVEMRQSPNIFSAEIIAQIQKIFEAQPIKMYWE